MLAGIDEAMEVIEDKTMDEEFREMAQEELKELKPQKEEVEEKLQILLLPKDLTMIKILSSKFAVALVVMKRHCLQATYSVCIQNMLKAKGGVVKLSMLMNLN